MGWIGSADTQAQVRLNFQTREEAVAFAERNGITYDLELAQPRHVRPKAYADNFRYGRIENWTHPRASPPSPTACQPNSTTSVGSVAAIRKVKLKPARNAGTSAKPPSRAALRQV